GPRDHGVLGGTHPANQERRGHAHPHGFASARIRVRTDSRRALIAIARGRVRPPLAIARGPGGLPAVPIAAAASPRLPVAAAASPRLPMAAAAPRRTSCHVDAP